MINSENKNQHLQSGKTAENMAKELMQKNGLKIIEQNYSTKPGEIDIIALDLHCLVFVEVRFRKNANFGGALESVTPTKQRKLKLAAEHYLQVHPIAKHISTRFDVIGICGEDIQWIQNAF